MRLRATLVATATLVASVGTTAALAASSGTAAAGPPVLQQSLSEHLAVTPATAAVRVLVQAGGSVAAAADAVRAAGLRLETTLPRIGVAVADGTPLGIRRLASSRGVTRLDWADQPVRLLGDTSHVATRAVPVQDGAYDVDGDGAGDAFDGKGFSVAVVDGGVDGTHPMLQGSGGSKVRKNVKVLCSDIAPTLTGYSSTYDSCVVDATALNDTDTLAEGGHGTHVAGIVAGSRVTDAAGRHLRGAAPGAEVVAVGMGASDSTYGGVIGMYWVLEHHADPCGNGSCAPVVAVNNSWKPDVQLSTSTSDPSFLVSRALVAAGVTVVWAAGNDGGDGTQSMVQPLAQDPTPGVIAVANYDDGGTAARDNALDPSSSRGLISDVSTYPDISAPGTGITSSCRLYLSLCATGVDFADPNYQTLTGTSMAAPHIAGYAADLQEAAVHVLHRTLTPGEVERLLVDTAHPFGHTTWVADSRDPGSTTPTSFDEGHGLVDLTAALARLTGLALTDPGPLGCASDARYVDQDGDATGVNGTFGLPGVPSEPSLDIRAAWFTSSPTTHDVALHWRVAALPATPGGTEGLGEEFHAVFGYGGRPVTVRAQRGQFIGQTFELEDPQGRSLAPLPSGSFDAATGEITATIPAALIASAYPGVPAFTSGSVVAQPSLTSYRYAAATSAADRAEGQCSYTVS